MSAHADAAQQLCRSVRAVASAAGLTTQEGAGAEAKQKFTLVLTGGLLAEGGVITRLLTERLALTCPLAVPVHPKVRCLHVAAHTKPPLFLPPATSQCTSCVASRCDSSLPSYK